MRSRLSSRGSTSLTCRIVRRSLGGVLLSTLFLCGRWLESPVRFPQPHSTFHPHAQRNASRRREVRQGVDRRSYGARHPAGVPFGEARKTAAQKNTNTAAAPVHSQKPKCQSTECRNAPRIGAARDGSSHVSSSRHSLQKTPVSGTSAVRDQIQNNHRPQLFKAHQQPANIPIGMNAAEERARSSWNRRIPRTAWMCCGTTRHAQISATTPAPKAHALTTAARGEVISKCLRKYPVSGNINKAASDIPQAGSQ